MKNNIFHNVLKGLMVVVALAAMDSVRAMEPKQSQPWNVADDFDFIMTTPWPNSDFFQKKIDNDWKDFYPDQKRAILQRMYDQGLLSESLLKNWNWRRLGVAPKATYRDYEDPVFKNIMENPWNSTMQKNVDVDWESNFNMGEKSAILQRMCDQGLLSQSQVDNWDMNVVPKATMGG